MGRRGTAPTSGRCKCGHRYRRHRNRVWNLPTPVAKAFDRTNAVRRVGPAAPLTGVGIQLAITENA